jgi:hypothetical protein
MLDLLLLTMSIGCFVTCVDVDRSVQRTKQHDDKLFRMCLDIGCYRLCRH